MEIDSKTIEQLQQRLEDVRAGLHIDEKTAELVQLDKETAKPGFWDDSAHAQAVSKRAGNLRRPQGKESFLRQRNDLRRDLFRTDDSGRRGHGRVI